MDAFHERLARVALDATAAYGFCLAGGYAVQAHGFVDRVSKDVDLFTTMAAASDFPAAVRAVEAAFQADGLDVVIEQEGATFARLAAVDAAANKLCALFGRAAVRDYIDVHGVLTDGRFAGPELLRMAADHDPGFDQAMFTEALRAVTRLPPSAFEPYKLTADQVDALCLRLLAWADEIEANLP